MMRTGLQKYDSISVLFYVLGNGWTFPQICFSTMNKISHDSSFQNKFHPRYSCKIFLPCYGSSEWIFFCKRTHGRNRLNFSLGSESTLTIRINLDHTSENDVQRAAIDIIGKRVTQIFFNIPWDSQSNPLMIMVLVVIWWE